LGEFFPIDVSNTPPTRMVTITAAYGGRSSSVAFTAVVLPAIAGLTCMPLSVDDPPSRSRHGWILYSYHDHASVVTGRNPQTRAVFERYNIVSSGDLRDAAQRLDTYASAV
jgi:hypothetical protein